MRIWIAVGLVAWLAGCSVLDQQTKSVENQPAPFRDGYRDGCASGLKAGGYNQYGFTKRLDRYDTERHYRDGWEDGYRSCRSWALS